MTKDEMLKAAIRFPNGANAEVVEMIEERGYVKVTEELWALPPNWVDTDVDGEG